MNGQLTITETRRIEIEAHGGASAHEKLLIRGMTFTVVEDGHGAPVDDLATDRTIWRTYAEKLGWAEEAPETPPAKAPKSKKKTSEGTK